MAHFAKVNNEIVIAVIVAEQDYINSLEDKDSYIQTSYNTRAGIHELGGIPLRKNYAGVGFTYDPERDAFIPPQPYASWTLDEETCLWVPPIPYPIDNNKYTWNEDTQAWDFVRSYEVIA